MKENHNIKKTPTVKLTLCILLALSCLCLFRTSYAQTIPDPNIQSIKAYLYYNQNERGNTAGGTMSENIIDNPDFTCWNVIIAEGSAAAPSNNTMVVVEIISDSTSYNSNGKVRLTARNSDGKIVSDIVQSFYMIGSGVVYHAPFMLYNTGCEELELKAELIIENKIVSEKSALLPFACGE